MRLQYREAMRLLMGMALWSALGGSTMAQAERREDSVRVDALLTAIGMLAPCANACISDPDAGVMEHAAMDFFDLPPATQAFYWGFFATNEEAADPHPEATLERLRLEAEVLEYDLGVLCRRIMLMECRPDAKGTLPGYSLPETNKP